MTKEFVHGTLLDELRELIIAGELPGGQKVPEGALCERFGVSRTPLREALKVLASEGHVELLPNRGARVRQLSVAEVEGLFDVAGALESLAGEQSCARVNDAQLQAITALHQRMAQAYAARDLPTYYVCNRAIHEAIIEAAHNPVLTELYAQVSSRIRRIRFTTPMSQTVWDRAMAEHEGMLNALARRDGTSLSGILKTHLNHKARAILDDLRAAEGPVRAVTRRRSSAATALPPINRLR